MIIGFTNKTSKFISKLLCKRFRHCVVIYEPADTGLKNTYILIQIASNGIRLIRIGLPQLKRLKAAGWVFVKTQTPPEQPCPYPGLLSCVGFAKRALSINKPFIWTPDGLYRYLVK